VDRVGGLHLAAEHVGDGRIGVGRHVEVVGQVALGVEVDRQHVQPDAAEDVEERPGRGGLARPALL
jgi:hypothetical protein